MDKCGMQIIMGSLEINCKFCLMKMTTVDGNEDDADDDGEKWH